MQDRTLHANAPGAPGHGRATPELHRAAAMVCMAPKGWGAPSREVSRAARKAALEGGIDGGHATTKSLSSLEAVEARRREIEESGRQHMVGLDGVKRRVPQARLSAYQLDLAGVLE